MTRSACRRVLCSLGVVAGLLACQRQSEPTHKVSEQQQTGEAKPDDACLRGMRCMGPKSALGCVQGKSTEIGCRGPGGCSQDAKGVKCDNTLARTGDACDEEHDFACALDRKAALECQAGAFRAVTAYAGIEGCKLEGDEITCSKDVPASCEDIEDIACCLSFARRPKAR